MTITALAPLDAAYWLWIVWYTTWWAAAVWASRAASRPAPSGRILHRFFALLGVFLLFYVPATATAAKMRAAAAMGIDPAEVQRWTGTLWTTPANVGWALLGGIVLCFAFCWWARVHLGRLWSGSVTVKADHRVVDTGPYGIVRHPIYTGIIVAALLTAVMKGSLPALAGFGFLWLGFWMTARIEEGFLRQQLGADAYDAYSRRVPRLIPFGG